MLELTGLSRRYGDVIALDDLSFTVPDSVMFGFVGPNGAGKTTAMRIILGVLAADSGAVRWKGKAVDRATRRRFGYMPEERGLYPKMRVRDHLAYLAQLHDMAPEAARRNAGQWIERLGLADRAGDPVEALSLGNQQRVQLAAALVHAPELLVLDEPFSGLDPLGVDVLAEVLQERTAAGVPVIFSSHQLELVERLCAAVAIVSKGRLVAAGDVEELRGRGPRRLRIALEGGDVAWAQRLAHVRTVEHAGGAILLELDAAADEQAILDRARQAGTVVHFSRERPTLGQLFREAVAA